MFFKKKHKKEVPREIICKNYINKALRYNWWKRKPQEIQGFRDSCSHEQATTFLIFYQKLFQQLNEQIFLKKIMGRISELMLLEKMLSFDTSQGFQASIH